MVSDRYKESNLIENVIDYLFACPVLIIFAYHKTEHQSSFKAEIDGSFDMINKRNLATKCPQAIGA